MTVSADSVAEDDGRTLLRFLLVGPLLGSVLARDDSHAVTVPSGHIPLESRLSASTSALTQDWRQFPDTFDHDAVELRRIALVRVGGVELLVADAYLRCGPPDQVTTIERRLTSSVVELAKKQGLSDSQVRWVSRTLVGPQDALANWLPHDAEATWIEELGATLRLAWGNNQVDAAATEREAAWEAMVHGLVDAQVLWIELEDIARASAESLLRLAHLAPQSRAARAELDRSLSIPGRFIEHELAHDELLLSVQGVRRATAESQLRSWRMPGLQDRIRRRIQDLSHLAGQVEKKRSEKYQGAVETILLFLGLTGLIQMALGFVQTAFSGGASEIPGGNQGLLQILRQTNLDALLVSASAASVAIFAYLMWRRRHG